MAKRQKKPAPRRKKASTGPSKAQVKKFMKAYIDHKNAKE